MASEPYRYAEIFVGTADRARVSQLIADQLAASITGGLVRLPGILFDVHASGDRDADPHSTDFVRWPSIIDVEADEFIRDIEVVSTISRALEGLWAGGIPAVAACDFEGELPHSGGIALHPPH